MPEANGSEYVARLQRMEKEHEEFRRDLRQLLTAQVLQKDQIDKLLASLEKEAEERRTQAQQLREKDAMLDRRVDDLVSAIGDLIRRIPPQNLIGFSGG
jgi:predicted  nucleic acid-binding Zn-ribbon protein